jgi:hypothetical protein
VDAARPDGVDAEIDRLISKRASQDRRPDRDVQEELWKESVRRYNDRKQEQLRNEWCEYHQGQAARLRAVFEPLIAHHEEQAQMLMDARAKGA